MESHQTNPLTKYFRQPSIYLRLPSDGEYWPSGSINMPDNKEIPVYPMTAADEIMLKTPDALINGQGVVNVIKSCCPNIVDPWQAPSIDIDSILIGIRIATYGDQMEFGAACPHCQSSHEYSLPLVEILGGVIKPDYESPIRVDGLSIVLKPQPYSSANRVNMVNFEEQRILQTLASTDIDDATRKNQFDEHLKRLVELNLDIIADSTASITTPEGVVVTDRGMIIEFYQNCGSQVIKAIEKKIAKINDAAKLKARQVQCTDCQSPFEIPIVFDYAHFFG